MEKQRRATTFDELWDEIEAEARAEGPEAVAELARTSHRFRVGAEIAVLRKQRGLTQQQLSDITGLDQAEISKIERGTSNATQDTLARVAAALGAELAVVPSKTLVGT